MLTPEELERIPKEFEKLFSKTELKIFNDIIERLEKNKNITRSLDWQLNRLHELGTSRSYVEKIINETLNISYEEIEKMYNKVLEKDYAWNKDLYKAMELDYIPYRENKELQQLVEAVKEQTKEAFTNITRTTGIAYKGGFENITDTYRRVLDSAVTDISTGAFDYNTVLKRTIKELKDSGLRTVDYKSGRKYRVETAVRMAVMTGLRQVTGKMSDMNAKALETEYFEVSWHGTARPTHQEWQGRVYSREDLEKVCGLGEVDGLEGANCRHSYWAFIPGISVRTYTDEQLDQMNAKENEKHEYRGKEYTKYEATQRQRELERRIRYQRESVALMKAGGADKDDVMIAESRYRLTMQQYVDFSKKMGLPEQRERIKVDTSEGNLDNILANRQRMNRSYDAGQYEKYNLIFNKDLGVNSIENFQDLKYTNIEKWESLKTDYRILNTINNKEWNADFKKRAINIYKEFKDEGYVMDSHFIGRFLQRRTYKNYPNISKNDVLEMIKESHNYKQDDRNIYFNELKQVALIQNSGNKEFISFVRRKTKKGDWEK